MFEQFSELNFSVLGVMKKSRRQWNVNININFKKLHNFGVQTLLLNNINTLTESSLVWSCDDSFFNQIWADFINPSCKQNKHFRQLK